MFEFLNPWVFLLLPMPILLYYFLPKKSTQNNTGLWVPFYNRINKIKNNNFNLNKKFNLRKSLLFILWLSFILALANPVWLGPISQLPRKGRDIMLAIDLSGSMQTPDMKLDGQPVDRLTMIKYVASKFIKKRTGDRIGLILFGTKAYLQTPLTFDHKTVLQMLHNAYIGLPGRQTAIGDAIGLGVKQLLKVPEKSRILILLTDGVNNSGVLKPLEAAKLAEQAHIKIYTIGIGSNRFVMQTPFGNQVINASQDLDTKSLKQIAKLTHGEFFRATNTQALNQAYKQIDKLEPVSGKKSGFRPTQPLYPWPLSVAFLLSVILSWRYGRKLA